MRVVIGRTCRDKRADSKGPASIYDFIDGAVPPAAIIKSNQP